MAGKPGGRMLAVADYVATHPGASKRETAHGIGQMNHNYGQGWGPVDRAIHAGLIICDWAHPKRARLFRTVEDLREYYGYPVNDEYWARRSHP